METVKILDANGKVIEVTKRAYDRVYSALGFTKIQEEGAPDGAEGNEGNEAKGTNAGGSGGSDTQGSSRGSAEDGNTDTTAVDTANSPEQSADDGDQRADDSAAHAVTPLTSEEYEDVMRNRPNVEAKLKEFGIELDKKTDVGSLRERLDEELTARGLKP